VNQDNKFTAHLRFLYKVNHMTQRSARLSSLDGAREWLRMQLCAGTDPPSSDRVRRPALATGLMGLTILVLAVGARTLQWQDNHVQITRSTTSLMGVFNRYRKEMDRILAEGAIVFPNEQPAPGDARMLAHPPGYSILMAAIKWKSAPVYEWLWVIQIAADAAAALLIFLIGSQLFGRRIGFIAGLLVAISPQLAYYCLLLTPDSLAALPVVASVYFLVLAMKRPRLRYLICSGALIGLSCWLAANSMGLILLLGLLVPFLLPSGNRAKYAAVFVISGLALIAPISIRNLVAYHRFIPISIQAGLSLVEGIGDFDREGKLGMPRSDQEARVKDVEWSGRPEYASSLWFPDGIERDRMRLSRGLGVVRERPTWFLGIMCQRAAFMLRYNDTKSYGWPQDSSVVGFVQAQPPFSHGLAYEPRQNLQTGGRKVLVFNSQVLDEAATLPGDAGLVWSASPSDLLASGRTLTSGAAATIEGNGNTLALAGDSSNYDDQFASGPIDVRPNTDYILSLQTTGSRGAMAVKILTQDRKVALASLNLADALRAAAFKKAQAAAGDDSVEPAPAQLPDVEIQTAFASGPRDRLCLVVSNNGDPLGHPTLGISGARLIALGPTSGQITHLPRLLLRAAQKLLFTTSRTVPLILAGFALCAFAKHWRVLVAITAVPIYYLGAQSPLHTEYRYVLGIHYFALVGAAITLSCGFSLCSDLIRRLARTRSEQPGAMRPEQALPPQQVED